MLGEVSEAAKRMSLILESFLIMCMVQLALLVDGFIHCYSVVLALLAAAAAASTSTS